MAEESKPFRVAKIVQSYVARDVSIQNAIAQLVGLGYTYSAASYALHMLNSGMFSQLDVLHYLGVS